MGMSASQARLLAITSRMNDIELRSQQIQTQKLDLQMNLNKLQMLTQKR